MASPADFVFNRAPTVGDLPQANFDWLGNLSQAYYAGQQNALQSRFARLGVNAYQQDAGGQQPQQSSGTPYSGDATSYNQATWNTESSNNPNVRDSSKGAVGVGQVMPGTWAKFAQPGEDIRNSDDNRRVSKRIQDHYMEKYNGDAARAAVAYFSGEGNVAPAGSSTPWKVNKSDGNIKTSEYVRRILAGMGNQRVAGVSQPGTGSPAPVEQPKGAVGYHPNMSVQSDNGAGPGNLKLASSGSPDEFVGQPSRATSTSEVAANTQGDSGSSGSIGPAPNVQPGNRDVVAQGPGPITQPGSVPGEPDNDPRIRRYDAQIQQKAAEMERNAKLSGLPYNEYRKSLSERQAKEMELLQQQRQELYSRLGKEREMQQGAGIERQKQEYGVGIEGRKQAQELNIKRGQQLYGAINASGLAYDQSGRELTRLSKSVLNNPKMYSGIGAEAVLDYNKVRANFGAPVAAQLQETLSKITARSVLDEINNQKFESMEGGSQATRIFAQTVEQVQKSSPNLEGTLAGNRALVVIKERFGEMQSKIAQEARDYMDRNHLDYLDKGWDTYVRNYVKNHPPFTKQELAHPELLGAPEHQQGVTITPWTRQMGMHHGDPFRSADGRYLGAP